MGSIGRQDPADVQTARSKIAEHPRDSCIDSQTKVLIVGGGPTGLTTAILLANHGIASIVVERHVSRLGQPKAHAINPRSLEILKQAGLNTKQLRSLGAHPCDADMVRFAQSMSGLEFGYLPYERQGDDTKTMTPEPLFNIPQPVLEEFLSHVVEQNHMITMWRGAQFENTSEKSATGLSSTILDRATGTTVEVHSKYLLLCDGANSRSRSKVGVSLGTLPGHPDITLHHVSVHIQADLTQFKSGTLWFFMSATRQGTFICYDRKSSWVFVMNYDAQIVPKERFTEEYCRTQIDEAIGEPTSYKVLSIVCWTTKPQIADTYRSKELPQAFLLGDAAHVFPPTGGLGVNTGIADAHNLVWKINAVENGWARSDFLDTFGTERRPIAIANARQSALNQQKIYKLIARTFAPDASDEELLHEPEIRQKLEAAIKDNTDHFDSINLQIGYVYGQTSHEPCDVYTPRCIAGARLPHCWIQMNGRTCSSLDLIDGQHFLIITGAHFSADTPNGLNQLENNQIPIVIYQLDKDFSMQDKGWIETVGLDTDSSAVLIRPDQHIVARCQTIAEIESSLARLFSNSYVSKT